MSTTLTCYGGVGEIGGNKILLEDGDRRVFFDFGRSFARYRKFFDGVFVAERPQRGLLDLLALEVLPPLPGLLRQDLIPAVDPSGLRPAGKAAALAPAAVEAFWSAWQQRFPQVFRDLRRGRRKPVDAILVSHAHLDHIGDMPYVSPDVPAYGTRLTAFICKALADMAQTPNGAASVRLRSLTPDGYLQADAARREPAARSWHFVDGAPVGRAGTDPLRDAASFAEGLRPLARSALKLESWPVDHSLFGAVGYAVETGAGWVAYTGDIRFSGLNAAGTRAYGERLAALKPAALLCEGTRLGGAGRVTEAEVHANCLKAVRAAAGQLVLADFSPRNVERLLAFADIAARTDRCLLIQPKDAYLLRAMGLADPTLTGDPLALPHVKLYADPKLRPAAWERAIRARCDSAGPLDIRRSPADYILAFSLADLADLLDLDFLSGGGTRGVYIFSNSQAYDDEQQVDMVRLWHWTQRLGLRTVGLRPRRNTRGEVVAVATEPGYHASGHAGADELAEFVRLVRPRKLVPVHTTAADQWPRLLAGTGIEIAQPRYAEALRVD